ncbi:GIY-YIG nuclease family protein [Pedobacter sp.]|jgi:putative endonuclease|uniref:GIY-YIG nuclease family protein n=1 Tax=Pedobacter sp. TaxID=1411316 RepID=UPI002B969924|nr:GIY-YIG nuclease family protein [Pedobacter sp.]HWW42128.1 GIY-YIG nuclease family protein [Pedobacter sp.]
MIVVYAIWSEEHRRIYVGMTRDIEKRLKEHNSGVTRSIRLFRPWKIIFTENCSNWESGRLKEKNYKKGIGKEFLKKLVQLINAYSWQR